MTRLGEKGIKKLESVYQVPKGFRRIWFAPSYCVNAKGEIFSFISLKILRNQRHSSGCYKVWLRGEDGTAKWYLNHLIVKRCGLGSLPRNLEV